MEFGKLSRVFPSPEAQHLLAPNLYLYSMLHPPPGGVTGASSLPGRKIEYPQAVVHLPRVHQMKSWQLQEASAGKDQDWL